MTTGLDTQKPLRDIGLLGLRTVVGATFLVHGVDKLLHLGAAEADFASLGIPAAAAMAPFVAVTEAGGGALLLAGLLTRLAGIALAGDMLVALLTAHIADGFFVNAGGGEFVIVLGGASLALALTGAGRFSVDAALDLERRLEQQAGLLRSRRRGEVATMRVRLGPAAGRRW
ncbi:MAG: DoxX family protein [Solirubrobacterales bacterium]